MSYSQSAFFKLMLDQLMVGRIRFPSRDSRAIMPLLPLGLDLPDVCDTTGAVRISELPVDDFSCEKARIFLVQL